MVAYQTHPEKYQNQKMSWHIIWDDKTSNVTKMTKISNKSTLSKIIMPVPVPVPITKSNIPSQNKVSDQLENLVNNRTSKENVDGKIDSGTIPLPNTTKLMAKSIYESKTAAQLQQYHHSVMGAIPVITYTAAIKEGWLSSFPGLSVEVVYKHLPKTIQSVMGHLHMIHKGICPSPGNKIVEVIELMNLVMEPDYEEDILHDLHLN